MRAASDFVRMAETRSSRCSGPRASVCCSARRSPSAASTSRRREAAISRARCSTWSSSDALATAASYSSHWGEQLRCIDCRLVVNEQRERTRSSSMRVAIRPEPSGAARPEPRLVDIRVARRPIRRRRGRIGERVRSVPQARRTLHRAEIRDQAAQHRLRPARAAGRRTRRLQAPGSPGRRQSTGCSASMPERRRPAPRARTLANASAASKLTAAARGPALSLYEAARRSR